MLNLPPEITFNQSNLVQCADGNFYTGVCAAGNVPSISGRVQITDFNYIGAFRLPGNIYGPNDPFDSLRYQQRAIIGLNKTTGNLLINGHGDQTSQNIAEFTIPELVNEQGGNFANLNMATNTQQFTNILGNIPLKGDPDHQGLTISGLYEQDGQIIVNYFAFYNALPPFNTESVLVKSNSANITGSTTDIAGAFKLTDAARYAGWMSDIPAEWQSALGGTVIRGHSGGNTRTINSRHSNGPSAAVFNVADLLGANTPANGSVLSQNVVLDYPLANFLGGAPSFNADDMNNAGQIWTTFSEAAYGFIIPGTDTYAVFGYSGGHNSGITYGIPSYSPTTPQGFYTNDQDDQENYCWLFDVNDLVRVRNGEIQPHEVLPYYHGEWVIPFGGTGRNFNNITGGAYDSATGRLYLTLSGADNQDALGNQSNMPMVVAFTIGGAG